MSFDLTRFYAEVDARYAEGHQQEVLGYLERSLDEVAAAHDAEAFVVVASELGGVLRARGELARAQSLYLEALQKLAASPKLNAESVAHLLINFGDVFVAADKNSEALLVFSAAEKILGSETRYPYEFSAICNNRSAAYRAQGDYERAKAELQRATELLEHVPNSAGRRATNAINLAQILVAEGELERAQEVLEPALKTYETLSGGRDIHRPQALWTMAQILKLRGEYELSLAATRQAQALLEDKVGSSELSAKLAQEAAQLEALCNRTKF